MQLVIRHSPRTTEYLIVFFRDAFFYSQYQTPPRCLKSLLKLLMPLTVKYDADTSNCAISWLGQAAHSKHHLSISSPSFRCDAAIVGGAALMITSTPITVPHA